MPPPSKSGTQSSRTMSQSPSPLKQTYLRAFNLLSALSWLVVLVRVVTIAPSAGKNAPQEVWVNVGTWTRWTQTLAIMEIFHSLFGIVRAPLFTTLIQVFSRFAVVWGAAYLFPGVPESTPAYVSMLLAWSITEVVRYSYFVAMLGGSIPGILVWLRYNTFFILYPIGASSEAIVIYKAIPDASKLHEYAGYALWALLSTYPPGFYTLYTHMIAQRRKIMRGKQRAKTQ